MSELKVPDEWSDGRFCYRLHLNGEVERGGSANGVKVWGGHVLEPRAAIEALWTAWNNRRAPVDDGGWVAVEERLPDWGEPVLICKVDGNATTPVSSARIPNSEGPGWHWEGMMAWIPTHWMKSPLPPPPREPGGEGE